MIRRKPVAILPLSPDLVDTEDVDRPVYYLKVTGEIFQDYERVYFYPHHTCLIRSALGTRDQSLTINETR